MEKQAIVAVSCKARDLPAVLEGLAPDVDCAIALTIARRLELDLEVVRDLASKGHGRAAFAKLDAALREAATDSNRVVKGAA